MQELIKIIENSSEELKLLTEVSNRCKGDSTIISELLMYKKLEDGILSKLTTANLNQLDIMKHSYKFRYYDCSITSNLIDAAIIKVTRAEKLKKINSI